MTPRAVPWQALAPGTRKVLIVNPYGIGDVLFTLPLLQALREALPTTTLGYLCNRRTESLVRAFPGVHVVRVFEKDEFRTRWRQSKRQWLADVRTLAQTLLRDRWDIAMDLSLNWQFGAALAWLGIPRRCGFDFRGRGRFLTDRLPLAGFDDRPVADYYLDLLQLLGLPRPARPALSLPLPPAAMQEAGDWLAQSGVTRDRPIIGLVPGGGASWGPQGAAKRWPPAAFAELGDRLADAAHGQLVLFGDLADRAVCDTVAGAVRHPAVIVGPAPSLLVLAGALRHCRLVVGNDSGALHVAAAVGVPSVAIFGPASPLVYGPYPPAAQDRHRVAVKTLACRPCYARFRLPPCPWEFRCLTTLPPADVYSIAQPLLAA